MNWLVTGGLGFIGTNLIKHLIGQGYEVTIIDDCSRQGVLENENYLKDKFGIVNNRIDISNKNDLDLFFQNNNNFDVIAHLAGQVSFLKSISDPYRDFQVNALGTLNLLENVRKFSKDALVIGVSSNKIYGDLHQIDFVETKMRYEVPDFPNGFNESLPISLEGPYGCSKGVLDQYLIDYARIYNLRTVSLRQSSVYGPHQHPMSDQGWVAFMVREAIKGNKIKLNGLGKQVRDLLHAQDLAKLFTKLAKKVQPGETNFFNIGGGVVNSLSILELFDLLNSKGFTKFEYEVGEFRSRDQKVFVSDNSKVNQYCGWVPEIDAKAGISAMIENEIGQSQGAM
jgi:CDP-paratose 2-epimerase